MIVGSASAASRPVSTVVASNPAHAPRLPFHVIAPEVDSRDHQLKETMDEPVGVGHVRSMLKLGY